MATPSHLKKEEKHQQGESPSGPKKDAARASGEESGAGNHQLAAAGLAVSSALSSGPADSAAAAIFIAHEDPGPLSEARVQAKRHCDLQGSRSPHADRRGAVFETAGQAAVEPPPQATGQSGGHRAQTKSPGRNRRRKQPRCDQAAQARELPGSRLFAAAPRPQCSHPLPLSPPRSQPSSSRHSQASTRSQQASRPGGGPALRSQASEPSPAVRRRSSTTPPGPALQPRASGPGPASRSQVTAPGPVLRSQCRGRTRNRAVPPDPALCRRATPPGPAVRHRASAPGCAPCSQVTLPGPALHSRARSPVAAVRRHASAPGRAPRTRITLPGPVLRSQSRRHSCSPGVPLGPALRSQARSPVAAVRRHASAPGRAPRTRITLPGPVLRSQSRGCTRNRAVPPGPALRIRATPPGPAVPRRASAPGRAPRTRITLPGPVLRSQSRGHIPSPAVPPGPAICSHASIPLSPQSATQTGKSSPLHEATPPSTQILWPKSRHHHRLLPFPPDLTAIKVFPAETPDIEEQRELKHPHSEISEF
uniref:Uncharacterized protein n=1 Tax=Prolemur simus TaxID=1328070 RepID=A0A8C9DPC0_PROSS